MLCNQFQMTSTHIVYIDALGKQKAREYLRRIRICGVHVKQVKGIRKDENDALLRLSDAIAGFVLDAYEKPKREVAKLFRQMIERGMLIKVEF